MPCMTRIGPSRAPGAASPDCPFMPEFCFRLDDDSAVGKWVFSRASAEYSSAKTPTTGSMRSIRLAPRCSNEQENCSSNEKT